MSTERPGIEELGRPRVRRGGWLPDWRFGLLVGLVVGLALVLVPPDFRRHALGGTEERTTTVLTATSRPGCDTGSVAVYELGWVDDAGTEHRSTFRRCGPQRLEVGEEISFWVSPDDDKAWEESPLALWLLALVVMPAVSLVLGLLGLWRQRVLARSVVRDAERRAASSGGAPGTSSPGGSLPG
jgi:hypothetical protein